MDLAIIIVSYNTRHDLETCLDSLHRNPPAASHEIVVVDNASRDGSPDAVASRWPEVRIIRLPANAGFAKGSNHGIRATESAHVLLLNSDTIVPAGAIDRLMAELHSLPGAAIVGPRLVNQTGQPELSYGRMMGPLAELRQKALVRVAGTSSIARLTSTVHEADWVSGACLLVRRSDAERAGLLDERYFMYCEDVDFCAAVRAHGGRVYFTPAAEVVHLVGRSRSAATEAAYRRSHLAFYDKHHPRWAPLLRFYLRLQGGVQGPSTDN